MSGKISRKTSELILMIFLGKNAHLLGRYRLTLGEDLDPESFRGIRVIFSFSNPPWHHQC